MYGMPQDVKNLTGVNPSDLGLDELENPEQALDELLGTWLNRITAAINVRLNAGQVTIKDPNYEGIVDVCVRTVAKLVAIAIQQRTSPIVQIGEFAVNILDTSKVTRDLEIELKPYQKKPVSFFSSNK